MSIERHWYQSSSTLVTFFLRPFSWLFRLVVAARVFLYRQRWKTVTEFSVPVIVVGNLSVGGTGKTPMVIWLANFLKQQGFHPGIVSRGVGGRGVRTPRWVSADAAPAAVGDEAVLLVQRTQCPMVVARNRAAAVNTLLAQTQCDVVISDDGLQHYRMGRHVEIVMVDGARKFGNRQMLPAGPLREPLQRLQQVDFMVVQGASDLLQQYSFAFQMHLQSTEFCAVNRAAKKSLREFAQQKVHAVAGIGHPERFFQQLRAMQLDVIEHRFPDHHLFRKNDFAFQDDLPVIMTEKDAVKCVEFADERFWCLPVSAELSDAFGKELLRFISEIIKRRKICKK